MTESWMSVESTSSRKNGKPKALHTHKKSRWGLCVSPGQGFSTPALLPDVEGPVIPRGAVLGLEGVPATTASHRLP